MGNPFKAKPGSKKLNSPGSVCPGTKAELLVEVYGYDPRTPATRSPIEGVDLAVTGGTPTAAAKTPANGQWRYQPLDPGTYTATPTFAPPLDDKYDVRAVGNKTRTLQAGDSKTVVFLVPSIWVEFIVVDTAAQTLPNIGWQLARMPGGGTAFKSYDSGATGADGKVLRLAVGTGTHKFTVKELTNPQWSATEAVIGEEMLLTAVTDGFNAGDAGSFEILDARSLAVLTTVPGTVKNTSGALRLEAKWKPAAGPFAGLTHSRIMFRATASGATAYSTRISLFNPDTLKFLDGQGKNVTQQVQLRFSDGSTSTVTTAKGSADVKVPWAEQLFAVKLTGLNAAVVKIDPGANPGGVAV